MIIYENIYLIVWQELKGKLKESLGRNRGSHCLISWNRIVSDCRHQLSQVTIIHCVTWCMKEK